MGIAAQMYTVRDFTKTAEGFSRTLTAIRKIGYEAVQLSAVAAMNGPSPLLTAIQAKRLLDDNGISCIATHRNWDDLVNQTASEIEFHKILDCSYLAIGGIPAKYGDLGEKGYRDFIRDAKPIISKLAEAGITFGYHNHAHEFQRIERSSRKTLYDLFIDDAYDEFTLEIDVYWAQHAGVNPVSLFERCTGRVPVIHLKDKEVVPGDGPVMAAIGEGNMEWDKILPACVMAGVEWYAIEQDECRRDPFDCLKSSYEYLANQGL